MMNQTSGLEKQVRTLRKRSLFTLFLTWLALFFTVVGIAAGYKNFLRVHDKAKEATLDAKVARDLLPELARKDAIQEWQHQVRQQLTLNSEQSARELAELKKVSNTSTYVADTLNEQVRQLTIQQEVLKSPQTQTNHWKAEEARYLLRTAQRKIQLDQDPGGAAKALHLADQVLIDIGLQVFLPVRQTLAKDIALLKRFKRPNQTALISRIDRLVSELKENMLSVETDVAETQEDLDGRNSLLERVKASINEVVVIRRYDQALAKRISGDAQSIRFELLRLKLENLKRLGLHQQVDAYQLQLDKIHKILQQEQPSSLTAELQAQLKSLADLVNKQSLPDLKSPVVMDIVLSGVEETEATEAAGTAQ